MLFILGRFAKSINTKFVPTPSINVLPIPFFKDQLSENCFLLMMVDIVITVHVMIVHFNWTLLTLAQSNVLTTIFTAITSTFCCSQLNPMSATNIVG